MARRKLTDREIAIMAQEMARGAPSTDLAERFGCEPSAVRRAVKRYKARGAAPPGRPTPPTKGPGPF